MKWSSYVIDVDPARLDEHDTAIICNNEVIGLQSLPILRGPFFQARLATSTIPYPVIESQKVHSLMAYLLYLRNAPRTLAYTNDPHYTEPLPLCW